jgi:LmbE family N-acetylglucosaminyl deacetylase
VRTALALSPHLDDAVFSCGGTLAILARAGWRVVVATLFTRSVPDPQGFALACQTDKGLGPEVDYMALRRAEDTAALRALGVDQPIHLAFPEAPHRGYRSAKELFAAPLPADDIVGDVQVAVADLLGSHAPDLVLAPQAVGGHVDHVQVVRALDGIDVPMLWWRDFPYMARTARPAEPFADRFAALPQADVPLDRATLTAKHTACQAYASQLGFQFGGPEGLRTMLDVNGRIERMSGAAPHDLAPAPA